MKRTFLAIQIQANSYLSDCYSQFKKELSNDLIKWVPVEHFHITLIFLGSTREEMIPHITETIRQSMIKAAVLEIEIQGCGVFPDVQNPHVLWFGIKKSPGLEELKQQIDKSLEEINFHTEERPFRPHLTFGRIKQIRKSDTLTKLLRRYQNKMFLCRKAESLIFLESQLTSSGPVYSVLERFMLSGSSASEASPGKEQEGYR